MDSNRANTGTFYLTIFIAVLTAAMLFFMLWARKYPDPAQAPSVNGGTLMSGYGWGPPIFLGSCLLLTVTLQFVSRRKRRESPPATSAMPPCSDQWLHTIAKDDDPGLSQVVRARVLDPSYEFDEHPAYIDFRILVFNGSVYTVSVSNSVEGHIGFRKQILMGSTKMISHMNKAVNLLHGREASFTVRLQLSQEEADLIRNAQRPNADVFHFGGLRVLVGVESRPEIEPKALILPDGIPVNTLSGLKLQYEAMIAKVESERNSLKSQLDQQTSPAVHVSYELDDLIVRHNQLNLDNPKPLVLINEGATAFDIQISDVDLGRHVIRFPVVASLSTDKSADVLVNILEDGIEILNRHDLAYAIASSVYEQHRKGDQEITYPLQLTYRNVQGKHFESQCEIRVSEPPVYQNVRTVFIGVKEIA